MSDVSEQLSREVARGQEAKDLLDHDLIRESFAIIRNNLLSEYEGSKSHDKEGREDAYRQLKALNEIKRHLSSVLETGKMAEQQITKMQQVKKVFLGRFA